MAALFQHRIPILIRVLIPVALAALATAAFAATRPPPPIFVDAILAEVDGATVAASDIALARALSLFGFRPSEDRILAADVERFVDAVLVEREAARLEVQVTPAEVSEAWREAAGRLGGVDALQSWLDRAGVAASWARRMVTMDRRWQSFIDLRFRAFAFVPEDEVLQGLGPGRHTAEARRRSRETLLAAAVDHDLAQWLTEVRARARIRRITAGREEVPTPFPMPGEEGRSRGQQQRE